MSDDLSSPNESARPAPRRPWPVRLETWLVLAAMGLLFLIFPTIFWGLLYWIDVRNWNWGVWVGVEIGIVVILLALWRWQKS